jgi:5-deoxy-glucuronate isomerase
MTNRNNSTQRLVLPAATTAQAGYDLVVEPGIAGWHYSSLRVFTLAAGQQRQIHTGGEEMIVLPLSGGATVTRGDVSFGLTGRACVFAGATDFAYLPIGDDEVTVASQAGGRFALTGARADQQLPFRYGPADQVPVEERGGGQASRLVRNFGTVGSFDTQQLIACEVLTPDGNWSSYPAHKHDRQSATESELEEIYYFEIGAGPGGEPGFGYMQTTASDDRPIDTLTEVRDRDTVLVPYGWHGPCVAAPGFDMYYLNVMAGPGERVWNISDHPEHAFVRDSWASQRIDPRLRNFREDA